MRTAGTEAVELWVDVTTLLAWRGKFTGIPRTISQLLNVWLYQDELRLRLCRYDIDRQTYREVPRPTVAALLQADRAAGLAAPAVRKRARRRLRTVLPAELREAARGLRHALVHLLRFGLRLARWSLRPLGRPGRSGCGAGRSARFAPGDVLLIPGGGWTDTGACEVLWRLKGIVRLRVVPIVYDLIPVKLPQLCAPQCPPLFGPWVRKLLCLCDLLLTISRNSRRDLLELAGQMGLAAVPAVEVLRLGDEPDGGGEAVRPAALADGPFVLAVGTVEVRKNHALLYHLWRRLLERHGERIPTLVLAGQPGWLTGELLQQLAADPLVRGRVLLLPDAADAELRWLYRHGLFTLYPSHYEGWGLPVAEGLAYGKLCICSQASSLPEIAGDLLCYHDPLDLPGCLELVERALFEPGFRQQREERIRRSFRVTSWRACAEQALGYLEHRLGVTLRAETLVRGVA
jgi:glycosyltransferase involved in cell wall biosynthesis